MRIRGRACFAAAVLADAVVDLWLASVAVKVVMVPGILIIVEAAVARTTLRAAFARIAGSLWRMRRDGLLAERLGTVRCGQQRRLFSLSSSSSSLWWRSYVVPARGGGATLALLATARPTILAHAPRTCRRSRRPEPMSPFGHLASLDSMV